MILNLLLLCVPLSLVLRYVLHASPTWVFVVSVVAIVPLAGWVSHGTDHVARRAGPAIGGLLNVTLGNVAELIIALFVLSRGAQSVVKAQITGSLVGNSLLGLGVGVIAGSIGRPRQRFGKERAGQLSSMLILTVIALLIPALFDWTERSRGAADVAGLDDRLSLGVSVVLVGLYLLNLLYTLVTHRDMFAIAEEGEGSVAATHEETAWPLWKSLSILTGATLLIALEAELLSGALEASAERMGLTPFFLGVIVLAVAGNAAEYLSAVYFARRDRMDLVMTITVGSTIQVALLTAPVLVIASHLMGHPMNLVFSSPLELIAIAATAFVVGSIAQDGETTWFEGVLLLGVYLLLGMAFFFVR